MAMNLVSLVMLGLAGPRTPLRVEPARSRSSPRAASTTTAPIDIAVSDAERASRVLSDGTVALARAAFCESGVVVLRNVLSLDVVEACSGTALTNLQACRTQLKKLGVAEMEAQGFAFTEICHRSKGRFDMQLRPGYAPVPIVQAGVELDAPWMPLVRELLGSSAKHLFTGAVVSVPGSAAQGQHMDGGHLFGVDGEQALMCPVHCLNVFVPLVPVTREKGPTEFWPGSHQLGQHTPREGGPGISVAPELALGDVALFDYRILHRGLPNQSDEPRPVMYVTYSKPWFSDVQNFPETRLFAAGPPAEAKGFASGPAGKAKRRK